MSMTGSVIYASVFGSGRTTKGIHSPSRACDRDRMLASHGDRMAAAGALPITLFALSLMLVGCAGSMPPPPPKLVFQWEPPSTTASAGNLAIAIVDARLTRDKLGNYHDAAYLTSYTRSLGTDLQRVLVAKGLKVTGPFDDFQNMTFPEKKNSDLALIPRVYLEINESYSVNKEEPGPLGGKAVIRQGQMSAHGFVELTLVEPMSEQKMWVKKIDLPGVSENISVDLFMGDDGKLNPFHQNKDNRDTALINMLNESYPRVLDAFWRYLDSDEIRHLAEEAKDAKKRKGY